MAKTRKSEERPSEQLFGSIREAVVALLENAYPDLAVQLERDFRGGKYDVLSIRVLKNNKDGRHGIVSEPTYYEDD